MKAPANCRLIGRWRIVEADLWDRAHLDLCGPATLTITAQGGEIAFGALEAGLEVEYARDSIGFRWAGCDEGDEVEGEGTAELLDDGTIEIEFAYETATKPSSKRNGTLLQQPARSAEDRFRLGCREQSKSADSPDRVFLHPHVPLEPHDRLHYATQLSEPSRRPKSRTSRRRPWSRSALAPCFFRYHDPQFRARESSAWRTSLLAILTTTATGRFGSVRSSSKLGHTPHIHEWEISGGGNIVAWMEQRHQDADHILCIISKAYLTKSYSSLERQERNGLP